MWEFGVGVAVGVALAAGPASPPLPDLRDLTGQPCNLPVSDSLTACPDLERQPPVTCVLPAALPATLVVQPDCPRRDRSPESRVLPVAPPAP